jgi:hypothetical protein
MVERVLDFIIEHYVANDILFYGDTKKEILEEFPTARKYKEWDLIEDACSVESLIKLEKKYFSYGPPDTKVGATYGSFCSKIKMNLNEQVHSGKVDLNNYEGMVEAWEKSVYDAANDNNYMTLKAFTGKEKIEKMFELFRPDDNNIKSVFINKVIDKELNYLSEVYDKVEQQRG